jgi:ABC-type transport system involved in multi-copper enzyme maturation permease subunit
MDSKKHLLQRLAKGNNTMFSLLQADLLKTRKRAMGWVMLALMILFVGLVMILSALTSPAEVTYAFPGGLLAAGQTINSLGALLMVIFGATLVGSEYGYDTWKSLLTRYHGRVAFILSKWLTLLIALGLGLLILVLLAQGLGLVLEATQHLTGTAAPLSVGAVLLLLLTQLLTPLAAGSFGILGAVIGRSSVAGIIAGIAWLLGDALLASFFQSASFSVHVSVLQAHITGMPAPIPTLVSLFAVAFFLVVPLAVAAIIFQRRDMVGAA